MWLNSDTLEKNVTNIYCHLKFPVWNHSMPCALEKTIMVEVSGHVSKLVNVIFVFQDVSSVLCTVTTIHPKVRMLQKVITVFQHENLALFMVTSICSIRKSTKHRLWNNMKSDRRFKVTQGSNKSKDRGIELINKELWRKRKEKVFSRRNWFIHNVKVV